MKNGHKNNGEHGEEWQLRDAKNSLSKVVEAALRKGPQTSLVQFFKESPLRGVELDVARCSETSREVEL